MSHFSTIKTKLKDKDVLIKALNTLSYSAQENVLLDNPSKLEILHRYQDKPNNEFLISELFSTDFSRCYLALKTLSSRPKEQTWPYLQSSLEKARKDYGALYFFLLRSSNSACRVFYFRMFGALFRKGAGRCTERKVGNAQETIT